MTTALWAWIQEETLTSDFEGFRVKNVPLVNRYDQLSRSTSPAAEMFEESGIRALQRLWYDDTEVLSFVDFLLVEADERSRDYLEGVLSRCGSAWKVGTRNGFAGLERRVPDGVQEAANEAMATPGHAGARLSQAWHAVYGVSPDPTKAYALAVRAVEDATIPTVTSVRGATLGSVIRQLEADGNWGMPLTREDLDAPPAQIIISICKALWKGHHDRHGGVPDAPQTVSHAEAEAAVHMAVFLVQGFASGLIARR